MRILLVSAFWPSSGRSGVAVAAADHARLLAEAGHQVSLLGCGPHEPDADLPAASRHCIACRGSGALYAPTVIDHVALRELLGRLTPGLVIVEAWQTALGDATLDTAHGLGIPTLMVSHGISVEAHSTHPVDRLRALAWRPYRRQLSARIRKLRAITSLDLAAQSPRFFDRDLARALGVDVYLLSNIPVHWRASTLEQSQRPSQIVCVGYFSRIKNQRLAIDILHRLPPPVRLLFIGEPRGRYFDACVARVRALGLVDRIDFRSDTECDIAEEISRSQLLLSTSITEALPIAQIEAFASGTPVVSTAVGAVPGMGAGLHGKNLPELLASIRALLEDPVLWQREVERGRRAYRDRYTRQRIGEQLRRAVDAATSKAYGAQVEPSR